VKGRQSFPRIYASLVILAGITAFLAACSNPTLAVPSPNPTGPSTPTIGETLVVTTATPTSSVPSLKLLQTPTLPSGADSSWTIVTTALRKIQQAGPFRVRSVTTTQDGNSWTLTGEVILPDNFHIVTPNKEILISGNQTYIREDGSWVKDNPNDMGAFISELMGNFSEPAIQGIAAAAVVQPAVLNGISTHEYKYQSDMGFGSATYPTDNRVWIDDETGLPVHVEITGQVAGVQFTTVQDIAYDPSISIETPSP
jgi:hypothetical protein